VLRTSEQRHNYVGDTIHEEKDKKKPTNDKPNVIGMNELPNYPQKFRQTTQWKTIIYENN
jgi:hypothetical protein